MFSNRPRVQELATNVQLLQLSFPHVDTFTEFAEFTQFYKAMCET